MGLIDKVKDTIEKYSMIRKGEHILIGLSGGADSVCLLKVLTLIKNDYEIKLSAIYVDHTLRPQETPYEIEFCKKICDDFDIPLILKSCNTQSYAKTAKISFQEAARELRYQIYDECAFQLKADKIALGHNADDQAETIFIRLIRGSGPLGLSGIPPVRQKIIRPLIEVERAEIESFLAKQDIDFLIDSSNLKDRYLRNKIRHVIMPEVKKLNPSAVKTITRTMDILRSEEKYFEIIVAKTLMKLISRKNDESLELFLSPMEVLDPVILRRVLRRAIDSTKGLRGISFIHIEDIIKLIKSGKAGDRIYLPDNIRVIKKYSVLLITAEKPKRLATYLINELGDIHLKESDILLTLELIEAEKLDEIDKDSQTVLINADKLSFPLTIRARMPGDFFYPLGFGKRKKIQDYFVDEKIPRDERDLIPLLINNGEVVWIVGKRLDDRYKIDNVTKKILKCNIKSLIK
ncbi:MAG: tRNA lysidine(34) synthetase TilS [Thermodesulfovibrionales bacterium]|nr:tRNA lysidine(34) synthetase TilS [Thermodesulfovibrionales bacterium]